MKTAVETTSTMADTALEAAAVRSVVPRAGAYQMLPPMAPEQFAALKTDIAARGVLTPIDVDDQGHILDGHHRHRACAELGITTYPVFVRPGLSEAEKRTFARQVNALRRHLTRAQIHHLIAGQLRDTPAWANARIARVLGVTDKTVATLRRRLEGTSEIPRLTAFEGADGKARPATQPTRAIFVPTVSDLHRVFARLADVLRADAPGPPAGFLTADDFIAQSVGVVVDPTYDPFAGCTDAQISDWLRFALFLVQAEGWPVDAAIVHLEWIRARRFTTVAEWMGEPGETWRQRVSMPAQPRTLGRVWSVFAATLAHASVSDLHAMLATEASRRRLANTWGQP